MPAPADARVPVAALAEQLLDPRPRGGGDVGVPVHDLGDRGQRNPGLGRYLGKRRPGPPGRQCLLVLLCLRVLLCLLALLLRRACWAGSGVVEQR